VVAYVVGRALIPVLGCKRVSSRSSPEKTFQRQHGWILSSFVAAVLFVFGLRLWINAVLVAIESGLDHAAWARFYSSEPDYIQFAIIFFMSHCIVDLVIGTIFYPASMDVLSGYVHHTLFLYVCLYSLQYCPVIFGMCFVAELPTLIMGLGNMDDRLRNDMLFGWTYGLTRIANHVVTTVLGAWALPDMRIALGLCSITLVLHIYWFYGFCTKYGCLRKVSKPKTA
jgi:hypothetical protein